MNITAKLSNLHKSLTIWFNSLMGAVIIGLPDAQLAFPQLQSYLPPKLYHYLMGAVIVGNIALRFRTSKPLDQK